MKRRARGKSEVLAVARPKASQGKTVARCAEVESGFEGASFCSPLSGGRMKNGSIDSWDLLGQAKGLALPSSPSLDVALFLRRLLRYPVRAVLEMKSSQMRVSALTRNRQRPEGRTAKRREAIVEAGRGALRRTARV